MQHCHQQGPELAGLPMNRNEGTTSMHASDRLKGRPVMQIGQAAPVVAALIKGTDKERVVSELYGGSGGQQAATDEVYSAIGNVSCSQKFAVIPNPCAKIVVPQD